MAGKKIALITNYMVVEYFSYILKGASRECRKNRDKLICLPVGDFDLPENKANKRSEIIKLIDKELFDGLIINEGPFFNISPPENYPEAIYRFYSLPAVGLATKFSKLPHIYLDNERGIDILFSHLVEHGCRQIAFISGPELNKDSQERTIAYLRNVKEHGFTIHEQFLQHTDFYPGYVDACLEDMLKDKNHLPDAIMCANDVIAENTITDLQSRGIEVPRQIKVTGFDNSSYALENRITTISIQRNLQGSEAAATLNKLMNKQNVKLYTKIPVKLVQRKSCGCNAEYEEAEFEQSYYKQIASLKQLALQIHRTGQNLNAAKSLNELKLLIEEAMQWIGVNDYAVYLFRSFEEKKGILHCSGGALADLKKFNSTETYKHFTKNVFASIQEGDICLLLPLYSKNLYLGILAIVQPKHDLVLYENLALQISEAIHTVWQMEDIQTKYASIQKSLREKELLLKEIHHRVKNNLQIITSLINLKTRNQEHRNLDDIVTDLQASISSIALVHETIYQKSNFENISLHNYLRSLFSSTYQLDTFSHRINISISGSDIQINLQKAINCGLIFSELFINTFKHAFTDQNEHLNKTISIHSEKTGNNLFKIVYSDNGTGFEPGPAGNVSFGLTIITSLVKDQLEGSFENLSKPGKGACFVLEIANDG